MKRMVVLVAFTGGLLLLSSAVALAAINSIECPGGECLGTEGDDSMNGTDAYDQMYGLGGNDNMFGHFGNDDMDGGSGADFLLGDEDYDFPDTFLGNDKIYGGDGNDFIFAYDRLAVTTGADVVDCGPGKDTVHYDKEVDKLRGCEIKVRTTQN